MGCAVACPEPLAAEVGFEILEKGGNAFDAMVAAISTPWVANPQMCGIAGHGGGAFLYHSREGRFEGYSFPILSGSKARADAYEIVGPGLTVKNHANLYGYKSIVVPRVLRTVEDIHSKYGTLPWKDLLQPAILIAREGFGVYPYLVHVGFNEEHLPYLSATKACADIYTKNGRPYRVGETLVQKDYGRTIERIAHEGADVFYRGDIAEAIASDIESHGGFVTLDDLHREEPEVYEPFRSDYKGLTILGDRPPAKGTLQIEAFNILEGIDLKKMGWNTPEYFDSFARVMVYVTRDKVQFMFDPNFVPGVLEVSERLRSKEYAASIRKDVLAKKDISPLIFESISTPLAVKHDGNTTYLALYDNQGNAVSIIHTIDAGAGVVTPGLGFQYSGHMETFDPRPDRPNSVAPRKRSVNGGLPPLVAKNGKPHVIIGGPRSRHSSEIQVILNIIEFGMHPQLALSAPRLEIQDSDDPSGSAHYTAVEFCVESSFPHPYPLRNVEASLGVKSIVRDKPGILSCIVIDAETGKLEAGADPRGGGGLAFHP